MCPGRDMSQVGGEVEEVHISMRHGGMEPSTQPGPDAGHWNVRWSQPQRFRTFYRETKGGTRFDLTMTSLQVSELRRCVLGDGGMQQQTRALPSSSIFLPAWLHPDGFYVPNHH